MKKPPITKVLLGGDGGTGKTTFLLSNQRGTYTEATLTIGVEIFITSPSPDQYAPKLLVFDLGGQERFQFLHDAFVAGTRAIILFYDLTRHVSFQHLRKWIMFLNSNLRVPVLVCGAKSDLVTEDVIQDFRLEFEDLQRNHPVLHDVVDHLVFSSKNPKDITRVFAKIWEITRSLPPNENVVSHVSLKSSV
jgi:Ras-related protein Rab-11A